VNRLGAKNPDKTEGMDTTHNTKIQLEEEAIRPRP
jgi:hypothetical protein